MDSLIRETYFDWLRSDCFVIPSERRTYEGVLKQIHDIPFFWTIISDDNRAGDARSFRQFEFLDQLDTDGMDQVVLAQWATAAPSVLEVLLGVARRWAYFHGGPSVPFYFNHVFRNMGYHLFPGRTLTHDQAERVRQLTDDWMNRQFMPNGFGSPFPLNQGFDGIPDMRNIDMWGQMNAYSAEHFQ